jgi:hypothetical protein
MTCEEAAVMAFLRTITQELHVPRLRPSWRLTRRRLSGDAEALSATDDEGSHPHASTT